jgi:hypothetical protein
VHGNHGERWSSLQPCRGAKRFAMPVNPEVPVPLLQSPSWRPKGSYFLLCGGLDCIKRFSDISQFVIINTFTHRTL